MVVTIEQGRWVEIRSVVLHAGERAPQVPEDTRQVPLEMRARGFLARPARPGEEALITTLTGLITTLTGRQLSGTLVSVEPAYDHGFGTPVPELLDIAGEVRALLEDGGGDQ
jgi:hypothetical protein